MWGRKADLSFMVEETQITGPQQNFWYAGLITTIHTCIVANRKIIHVPKSKGAVVF